MNASTVLTMAYAWQWITYAYPLMVIITAMVVYLTVADLLASAKKGM